MAAPTLYDKYEKLVKELIIETDRVSDMFNIENSYEWVHAQLFNYVNYRVIDILDLMENTNASTITKGLLDMIPRELDSEVELIEGLVSYHTQEKQALRRYRSKNGKSLKIKDFELELKKLTERTRNKADNVVD